MDSNLFDDIDNDVIGEARSAKSMSHRRNGRQRNDATSAPRTHTDNKQHNSARSAKHVATIQPKRSQSEPARQSQRRAAPIRSAEAARTAPYAHAPAKPSSKPAAEREQRKQRKQKEQKRRKSAQEIYHDSLLWLSEHIHVIIIIGAIAVISGVLINRYISVAVSALFIGLGWLIQRENNDSEPYSIYVTALVVLLIPYLF